MLSLIAAMAMMGANVPLSKLLIAAIPVEVLLLLRFVVASTVLALLARAEPGPSLGALNARQWSEVFVLALAGSVLFTWFVLEGVRRTSGGSAGIIMAALPAVVAVAGLMLGERLRRGEGAMIALAVAGVAMIQAWGGARNGPASGIAGEIVGNLLIGCAVLCEATFILVARRISTEVGPMRLSLAVALVSLGVCAPFGLGGVVRLEASAVSPHMWALLVWYALTASVLCTVLWYRGVGHVERWAAGLATAAVPVAALSVSAVVLGERISAAQMAGGALVIGAIVVGTLAGRGR